MYGLLVVATIPILYVLDKDWYEVLMHMANELQTVLLEKIEKVATISVSKNGISIY